MGVVKRFLFFALALPAHGLHSIGATAIMPSMIGGG
jgi:hypothetical protein